MMTLSLESTRVTHLARKCGVKKKSVLQATNGMKSHACVSV